MATNSSNDTSPIEKSTSPVETMAPHGKDKAKTHCNTLDLDDDNCVLPGTAQMERVRMVMTKTDYWTLFGTMFLAAYVQNLDYTVRSTFVAYASAAYQEHSLLATINVVRGVIGGSVQPIAAKFADLAGRLPVFSVAVVFWVLGTIVQAAGGSLATLAVGALLQQIGYAVVQLIMEVIIADITPLRSRTFFFFLPGSAYVINAWISGNITESVLKHTTWRWGIGLFGIVFPVGTIPHILVLYLLIRRANKRFGNTADVSALSIFRGRKVLDVVIDLFWRLDILGLFVLTAFLSMFLIPMTLAGGSTEKWKDAGILTPIIIGFLFLFVFIYVEYRAKYPIMPIAMIKERNIWAALGIAVFTAFVWACQGNYLYTVLLVGYDFTIAEATRVASVYSFCELISGVFIGSLIYYFRRFKYLTIIGCACYFVGLGIMLQYRGGNHTNARVGVIAGQVLVGFAGSWFCFPNAIAAQSMTKHKDIAVLTSLWMLSNWVGMAFGECVAGAIWTQVLYEQLSVDLTPVNAELIQQVYASPLYVVPNYPVGTPERTAIIHSYKHIQRLLIIAALCLTGPIFIFTLCLRNTKLQGRFYGDK